MILSLLLIGGLLSSLSVILFTNWIDKWYDFWIILTSFVSGILAVVLVIVIVVVIGSWFVKMDKEYKEASKFHNRTVKRVCEFLLQITRCKVNYRGMSNLPQNEKFLMITNHQALFDSVATLWLMRGFPMSFVLKKSLMKYPLLKQYLHASGYLPLDRDNAREGVRTINSAANLISDNYASITICPEGTRSGSYEMGEFHSGSFKIAMKAQCPIVLVAIQNSCQVKKRSPWKSTNIYFDVIEVIPYEEYKDKNTQEISEYCHKVMKERLEELPKY